MYTYSCCQNKETEPAFSMSNGT